MSSWPDRQGGAVTLIGALFIIITLALMVQVLQRMAASDVLDSTLQNDAVEALFIAESGIEHASYLYANGTTCADLSLLNDIDAGRGKFHITASVLVGSDCQIRVRGEISTFGVQRTVDATLRNDGNLLGDTNPDFNEPDMFPCSAPSCSPTGWNLPAGGWDDNGGPSGVGDRAAYVEKPINGAHTATTAGSFGLSPFTVTAPATLTLDFDYKVIASGGGNSAKVSYLFSVWDGTTTYAAPDVDIKSSTSSGANDFVPGTVSISISGSGPVTIMEFRFSMEAKSGQPKWGWLDNLDLRGPGGGGGLHLLQWAEVVSN
ncbi:MAG: hypothetical protein U9P00_07145 [Pseudomonadota bacterium]|nr:hypothetical protein [Pseudomonadota bacterium]